MKRRGFALAAAPILALTAASAAAKDLGARGASWPVAETDLLTAISGRLEEMSASGEWARLERAARARARRSLEEPPPVPGIAPAAARRVRRFDPTVEAAEDIVGPGGEVVVAAGARVNPFAYAPLSSELLFIDGRREAEVAWALARAAAAPAKIVLLAGRPLDLMRRSGRRFYFDLGGRLAARFGVRATPTRAARDGMFLELTEIPLADELPFSGPPPPPGPDDPGPRETIPMPNLEPDPQETTPC